MGSRAQRKLNEARTEFLDLRGLRHQIWHWGAADAPLFLLLHGWMDCGASFQFLADALQPRWHLVAPDWRGFGKSQWGEGAYWFPDYVADLEALLNAISPDAPVIMAGASMGGNIACLYAGLRPQRVSRLITLEGFGLPDSPPEQAPQRLLHWLDELGQPLRRPTYADFHQLAQRLRRDNPNLTAERAEFLARHLSRAVAQGGLELAADPRHRLVNPILYRIEEVMACWRRVTAPVLWVQGAQSTVVKRFFTHEEDYRARIACFAKLRQAVIEGAGHNLHWEQPQALARLLEDFLAA